MRSLRSRTRLVDAPRRPDAVRRGERRRRPLVGRGREEEEHHGQGRTGDQGVSAGADSQYRDHGAHRRGQDHDDRAHPLLHRPYLQDRRGPRGRRGHGLDGPGARARDHHHVRGDHVQVARLLDQHHRHAGPRRLHRRGRALAAGARRCGRGLRRGRGGRAPDRDGLASGQQVPRPPHVLRQQDGPHRRGLLPLSGHDQGPPRRRGRGHPAADRRRERVPRRHRPAEDEGAGLGRRHGRGVPGRRHPRGPRGRRRDLAPRARRRRVPARREHPREVRRRRGDHRRGPSHRPPARDDHRRRRPDPLWHRVQEQGRPTAARRRRRLPPEPARRHRDRGDGHLRRARDGPPRRRQRAVRGPRVQDHERPVRRQAHLLPRVLGQRRVRRRSVERDQGQEGADRASAPDAREPPRGQGGGVRRRHRGGRRAEEHHDR